MAIQSSSGSSHLRPGAFHIFYKYTTGLTYINENGRKKNKPERTWVSPKRKKGEVLALFWHSVANASEYPNEIPIPLSGTLTHHLTLANLAFWSTNPISSLQQPPFSLTVALFLGFAPKQTKEPSDWHSPTPTPTERMHTIVPHPIKSGVVIIRSVVLNKIIL